MLFMLFMQLTRSVYALLCAKTARAGEVHRASYMSSVQTTMADELPPAATYCHSYALLVTAGLLSCLLFVLLPFLPNSVRDASHDSARRDTALPTITPL